MEFRDKNPTAAELAASAALYFCMEEGQFNGCQPGLMVVMQMLEETLTKLPPGDDDIALELMKFLDTGPKYADLLNWMERFYE